jgi:hypothetical protein
MISRPFCAKSSLVLGSALVFSLFFGSSRALADCPLITNGPQLLLATVEACRSPEQEALEALEFHRFELGGEIEWASSVLRRELRLKPRVIVTLTVREFRQLSWFPGSDKEITAEPWQAAESSALKDYLLNFRTEGCSSLPLGEDVLLITEIVCCCIVPPNESACLLRLPVVSLAPEEVAARYR